MDTVFFIITPIIFFVIPIIILLGTVHEKYCVLVNPIPKYKENENEKYFTDLEIIKTRKMFL